MRASDAPSARADSTNAISRSRRISPRTRRAVSVQPNAPIRNISISRLGLKNAHEAKICLDCHADNIPESQRGPQFVLADGVPAVIIAHGRNGHGAWRGGTERAVPARHVDEGDNANADERFMSRDYAMGAEACDDLQSRGAPLCAFDDQLRWISPNVLAARLVSGGRLP